MPTTEPTGPQRAPLFWAILPFLAGLVLARYYPGAGNPLAVALAVVLLTMVGVGRFVEGWRWGVAFPVAVLALGVAYATLFAAFSSAPLASGLPDPPREQFPVVEPVQTFQSPPYADYYSGLARVVGGAEGFWYFSAPASASGEALLRGYHYKLRGVPRSLDELVSDPGFRSYLQSRGVSAGIRSITVPLEVGRGSLFTAGLSLLREEAKEGLTAGSTPTDPKTRIYLATVLGERSGLSTGQKEAFRETGTAHLFAISGLHVGLGWFVSFFRQPFDSHERRTAYFPVPRHSSLLCTAHRCCTLGRAAFLMIAFLWGARLVQRDYRPESALAASAGVVSAFRAGATLHPWVPAVICRCLLHSYARSSIVAEANREY